VASDQIDSTYDIQNSLHDYSHVNSNLTRDNAIIDLFFIQDPVSGNYTIQSSTVTTAFNYNTLQSGSLNNITIPPVYSATELRLMNPIPININNTNYLYYFLFNDGFNTPYNIRIEFGLVVSAIPSQLNITTYQVRLPTGACATARANTISTMLSSLGNIPCTLVDPTLTLPFSMSPVPVYNGNCTLPTTGPFSFNGASTGISGTNAEYRFLTYDTYTRPNYLGISYRRPVGFRSETDTNALYPTSMYAVYKWFDLSAPTAFQYTLCSTIFQYNVTRLI
jgi:hypothetical protein